MGNPKPKWWDRLLSGTSTPFHLFASVAITFFISYGADVGVQKAVDQFYNDILALAPNAVFIGHQLKAVDIHDFIEQFYPVGTSLGFVLTFIFMIIVFVRVLAKKPLKPPVRKIFDRMVKSIGAILVFGVLFVLMIGFCEAYLRLVHPVNTFILYGAALLIAAVYLLLIGFSIFYYLTDLIGMYREA